MRTITLEEHFITQSFLKVIQASGQETPPAIAQLHPKLLDLAEGRIAAMNEAAIDYQILSLASWALMRWMPIRPPGSPAR